MNKLMICLPEDKQSLSILKYAIEFAAYYKIPYELMLIKRAKYFREELTFVDVEMPRVYLSNKKNPEQRESYVNIIEAAKSMVASTGVFSVVEDSADLVEMLDEKYRFNSFSLLLLPHISDSKEWPFLDSLMLFIKEINCPVMLIEADTVFHPISHAVYASNYLSADANVINRFMRLYASNISKIDIIHISFSENFKERILEKGFEAYIKEKVPDIEVKVHHTPAIHSQHSTIDIFLNEVSLLSPDLLILMKEQKTALEEFFQKSFTISTAKKTSIPLLILHERYVRINRE